MPGLLRSSKIEWIHLLIRRKVDEERKMRRDSELQRRIQERVSVREDDILRLDIVLEDG